jgi:hypothetical protein
MQIQGCSDQGNMRECLRKVSDLTMRVTVVLLREEPNIIPEGAAECRHPAAPVRRRSRGGVGVRPPALALRMK